MMLMLMNGLTAFILLLTTGFLPVTFGFLVHPPPPLQSRGHGIGVGVGRHPKSAVVALRAFQVSGMWTNGLSFGKGQFRFYKSFDSWMSVFSEQDRQAYPEVFNLPKGTYEVVMKKPLGIVFEEIEVGKGVYVQDLVQGGAADRLNGVIQRGDVLIGITAIKVVGAKWERRLLPARPFDFDTVIGAISSNEPKWGCDDVVLCEYLYHGYDIYYILCVNDKSGIMMICMHACIHASVQV